MARRTALLLALASLAACSSTRLTSVWVEPERAARPLARILVVGLAEREGNRASFEHEFAARLAERGATGVPSMDAFPDLDDFSRERVAGWARAHGVEGVLISRLVDVREEQRYVPPEVRYDLYGYWGGLTPVVVAPGYVQTDRTVVIETNLFDARDGALVYSATSESFNPASDARVVRELVDALVDDLAKRGLLPPVPGEEGG
jgi:hypothetical protein